MSVGSSSLGHAARQLTRLRPLSLSHTHTHAHTHTPLAGEVEGYPDSGLDGATRALPRVRITSIGRAVLGETYGPGVEASSSSGSGSDSLAPAQAPTVEVSPGAVCPHRLFSKRVPTAADIAAQGPLPLPEAQQLLAERCMAAFRESAEVEALLHLGGRRCLRDFDVVDVLPPARRRGFSGDSGSGATSSAALERQLQELAMQGGRGRQDIICPLGHEAVMQQAGEGSSSGSGSGSGSSLLSPYRACAFRRPRRGLFYSSSSSSGGGSSSSSSRGLGGGSAAAEEAAAGEAEAKEDLGGMSLGAHASCHAWSPARVKFLTAEEASQVAGELTRRTVSRASFSGRSMSFADAEAWEEAEASAEAGSSSSSSSSSRSNSSSGGAGGGSSSAKRLYAFWYEFAPRVVSQEGDGTGSSTPPTTTTSRGSGVTANPTSVLRFAPLCQLTAVAPLGAYTWPFVPSMRVDARRLGGKWSVATVVACDRYFVTLRVPRPPNDTSAGDPKALAVLPGMGASVRVDRSAPARVGGAGAETLRVVAEVGAAAAGAGGGAGAAAAGGRGGSEEVSKEDGGSGGSGRGGGHVLPLAGAGEGCEVVPAQLWRHLVGRLGVHTRASVDAASAMLLPSLKTRGLESWLVGLQAPVSR